MTRLPAWIAQSVVGLRFLVMLTLTVGLAFPLALTGFAQIAFPHRADEVAAHRLTDQQGNPIPTYFQGRASLAHTNVPGCRNAKRWQDIQELLDAGITVLSTVNIQHLESLNDVITEITGVVQRETVPDAVVRAADQVELVDMTAEALRRRMAHGNVYPPDTAEKALANYFRTGNLTALRELALLWLADKVDDQLDRYRAEHGITAPWQARERIVVALTGGPEGDTILRRAARIAERTTGAELLAVHVVRSDGLRGAGPEHLIRQRALVEGLGGSYHQVVGNDIGSALLHFARGVNASQLVLGASRRGRWAQLFTAGVGAGVVARSESIDVHFVHHEATGRRALEGLSSSLLSRRRRVVGLAVAAVGLPLLVAAMLPFRQQLNLSTEIELVMAMVVAVALIGGLYPAVVAAVAGLLLLAYFFTPPLDNFGIADGDNLLSLVVFVLVALTVSTGVEVAARRTAEAARASAETDLLSGLAGSVLRGDSALPAILDQLRESFSMRSVTLLERVADASADPEPTHNPAHWRVVATSGEGVSPSPAHGDVTVAADDSLTLVMCGRPLLATEQRVVAAVAAQAAVAFHQKRLAEQAAAVVPLAEADRMRTALLSAVTHDLRTPLASAMAAVLSLQDKEVEFSESDRDNLLATAHQSLARLERLISNLLDTSRLQAGVMGIKSRVVGVEELLPGAIDDIGAEAAAVSLAIPDDLPAVRADPALVERVLVNLLRNALHYSPTRPPTVIASTHGDAVQLRVVDHGPGIAEEDREQAFLPFQRLGDPTNSTGVGLGLALSRSLTEAMGGTLDAETTPGGGLTMVLTLPQEQC